MLFFTLVEATDGAPVLANKLLLSTLLVEDVIADVVLDMDCHMLGNGEIITLCPVLSLCLCTDALHTEHSLV